MTLLARVVIESAGYLGAPGYNIMHFSPGTISGFDHQTIADSACQDVSDRYQDVQSFFVDDETWTIGPTVPFFKVTTGESVAEVTASFSNQVITGTGSDIYMDRSACVNVAFRTNDFVSGRRLIGRSFVGPISAQAFASNGQIQNTALAAFGGMFDGAISGLGPMLAVWHRPTTPSGTDGSYGDVVTVTARSVPGTLRSRKT